MYNRNMKLSKFPIFAISIVSLLSPIQCLELSSRIVGGVSAGADDYPYFAFPDGDILCGATLIWNDILVSAAHCGEDAWTDGVWVGGNHLNKKTSKYYSVNTSVIHPEYDAGATVNDIILIKIDGNYSGPLSQLNYNSSLPADNQELTAIGYGTKREGGRISPKLQKVNFFAVGYEECEETYGSALVDDVMLCNGGIPKGGKDTCQGDSGGPIFLAGTNMQVGIVSFGEGCARAGIPGVNSRVSAFEFWIKSTICDLSANPPLECQFMTTRYTAPKPTSNPTRKPITARTRRPTKQPINRPTKQPVRPPTLRPTKQPVTRRPTKQPVTRRPTKSPVRPPTRRPTTKPVMRAAPTVPVLAPTSIFPVPTTTFSCTKKQIGERCIDATECCGTNPDCTGAVIKVCSEQLP
jgi:Trypsin